MAIKKYTNGSLVSASYRKYGTETDTITTLPTTVIGDGTPISSYIIKGNMEQTGTPTPSSPIYPSECGERTENLCFKTITGVNINASGTLTDNSAYAVEVFEIEQGKTYTIKCAANLVIYAMYTQEPMRTGAISYDGNRVVVERTYEDTFVAPIDGYCAVRRGDSGNKSITVAGSTAPTSYIPYGYKLPLTLGSTTTNIYLGEVQTTRRIKKLEFDGTEDWSVYNSGASTFFYTTVTSSGLSDARSIVSSHFVGVSISTNNTSVGVQLLTTQLRMRPESVASTTITDFKAFLAQQYANGTPVTVWYVLAASTTGIVNEPIRKIGDYVDSVSGTNLATSGTAQEFDVDTTLKPSEVDMTYHGWHEHEDTKYST